MPDFATAQAQGRTHEPCVPTQLTALSVIVGGRMHQGASLPANRSQQTHIYTQNRHQTVGDFWGSSQPDAGYELIFTNKSRILLLYRAKLLHIDRLHHLLAVGYRGLLEGLAATELFNDASLFKFTLEFLQSAFDVLAFFYLYDNHCAVNLLDFCSVV